MSSDTCEYPSSSSVDGRSSCSVPDVWLDGLMTCFTPALQDMDESVNTVYQSQQSLAAQIDRLNVALNQFKQYSQITVIQQYTNKLQNAKKRLKRLHGNVDKINQRLENVKKIKLLTKYHIKHNY